MSWVQIPSLAPSAFALPFAMAMLRRDGFSHDKFWERVGEGGPFDNIQSCVRHVHVLESIASPSRHYIGSAFDVERRLSEHNSGKSIHTNKFRPWQILVTISFRDDLQAEAFERYLKSGSGRAFIKRHLT